MQFALDLVAGEGTTPYAKKVIAEVQEYRKRQAENGRNRWKDLNKRKDRVAKRAISEPVGSHEGRTGNSSSISSSSTETEALKPKVKRFVPPSVEEVHEYMQKISYKGDAQKWIDFYTGKGWMIGKNKMVDWKAAVRTWKGNDKSSQSDNRFEGWLDGS